MTKSNTAIDTASDPALALARLIDEHSASHERLAKLSWHPDVSAGKMCGGTHSKYIIERGGDAHELMRDISLQALCLAKATTMQGALAKLFTAFGVLMQEDESPHDNQFEHKRQIDLAKLLIDDAQRVIEDRYGLMANMAPTFWWSSHWSPASALQESAVLADELDAACSTVQCKPL